MFAGPANRPAPGNEWIAGAGSVQAATGVVLHRAEMNVLDFDLARLLEHPTLTLRHLICPTIFRLAATQKQWIMGEREVAVSRRPTLRGAREPVSVRFFWALRELEPPTRYNEFREELRKLKATMNVQQLTELAALGVAFGLVSVLLPDDAVTDVVQVGGRGDFELNGRQDQMIEISGVTKELIEDRFSQKKKQILLNKRLTRAIVSVTGFDPPLSRLERVK